MVKKTGKLSFEEWVERVDDLVTDRFGSSLSDLEDDISANTLKEAYEDGLSPATFFREEVVILFDDDEDDDGDFEDDED